MNITIETIQDCRIAYVRQVGPYGAENIKTMEKLKAWAYSAGLLDEESIILGIARDNPELVEPKSCRYDACLLIPCEYSIKDETVHDDKLCGGKYAVIKISHTAEAVQKAWLTIFPELYRLNYQMDNTRPILERYKAGLVKEHYCEICVPVL